MATLKTCFKCGVEQPRTAFYAHPRMADGLLGKCKRCARLDGRNHRAARPEYYKAYDKDRYRNDAVRAANARATFKRAGEKHPEQKAASTMVANAVRDGRLKRQPCWVCGEYAEAHHPDYSRPLDVVWLCVLHHRQAHGLTRRIDNELEAA